MKLSEIADISVGFPFKSINFNIVGSGIRLVRGKNVTKRALRWGDDTRWWEKIDEVPEMYSLRKDDIVLGMDGSLVGKNFARIREEDLPLFLVQRVACVRAKEGISQDYLWECIASEYFSKYVDSIKTGTSIPHISGSQIADFELPNIDTETMRKIGEILICMDKKIDTNDKINRNLSEQSSMLFDEWFGKYVYNQIEIPNGWNFEEIKNLDVLVTDYVANGSFKSLADNVQYLSEETNNVLIRLTDFNNNYASDMVHISDASYEFLSKSKLEGDEIIISNVGANVGTVFRCPRLEKRMSLAPNSIMLRSDLYEHYLYLYFLSMYGQHQLQSIVTGSAQPKFNKTNFRALKVLVPETNELKKFNEVYGYIHEMITKNHVESNKLSRLRDSLLPKLMSGELDVSDLNI